MGDCRRPEFEWGLLKSSHNWPSAVADVRHFEHHTLWQVYLTLGTRGLRTVAYLLRVRIDIVRNFAICYHTKSPMTKVVLRKLAKAAVLVTCVWVMLGSHLGATPNIWHCYSWFAIVAPGKWQDRLFQFCQDCLLHIHYNSTVILSHETVKWIFCISLPVCKVQCLVRVHTLFSATSLFETDVTYLKKTVKFAAYMQLFVTVKIQKNSK
jgi:hypothetical protein